MQTMSTPKRKCNLCGRVRQLVRQIENDICYTCNIANIVLIPSGNKAIDDLLRFTQVFPGSMKMQFIPYTNLKNIISIAEGGFSKIYKATWIDGPVIKWNEANQNFIRRGETTVALKELYDSNNITTQELHLLKKVHRIKDFRPFNKYYGITLNPITQNFIIVMRYYEYGNIIHYMTDDFYNGSWYDKLYILINIIKGLKNLHKYKIIHKDFHGGNIFFFDKSYKTVTISDMGINKSSLNYKEIYGIIPYIAPEIFQGQKYTKASDVYSFGMIMWELMTGRRSFWDQSHDANLIVAICNGHLPPIVTNAPEGYIELMKECWCSEPMKRPEPKVIFAKLHDIWRKEYVCPTEIMKSPDIGPTIDYNPGAIYKNRSLNVFIKSAESIRNSKSQSKRKIEDNLVEENNNIDEHIMIKKIKLFDENNDENRFDIDDNEVEFNIDNEEIKIDIDDEGKISIPF
ncbi:hypothetical protein RclHR1_09760002 [Rhizophagus clarus]|uniref:Protein kinase domain-containing protein n=1 Tax=Rhizophagus clarus TaxID=94130 RepID=A0A2Z6SJ50_9GLOM|nr:hypothetical protein RclHR1_09760002 [Rhizophagus clarus]